MSLFYRSAFAGDSGLCGLQLRSVLSLDRLGRRGGGGGHMRDDVLKFIIAAAHKINVIVRSLVAYGPCTNGDGRVVVIKLSPAWSSLGIS